MKKEFLFCFLYQLIGFTNALGLNHEPTIYLNEHTVSPEEKENNVSMVDNIKICYRTNDKDVLEDSCIASKCILVPYRFSIKDNTNWMKRVWLRTFPLMNWKDTFLDRAMFFALEPPSDTMHVPEFSGTVLFGNNTPIFKFTLETYQKTLGDSVMFFVDSQNVDEITCINSKCFHKFGECKDRICSCFCNYNMFKLTYYIDIVCDMCTFGVEWRFVNIEKGSIFKQYLSRTYDSTGFGHLDSHSEILRGEYQDDTIDVSAAEGSLLGQSKNGGLVYLIFLTVSTTILILPLLYLSIKRYALKRKRQRARGLINCVSRSETAANTNCMCDFDYENGKESVNLMTKLECKNTIERKGRPLKQIKRDNDVKSHGLGVALKDNRVEQPEDHIQTDEDKKLSKDKIKDQEEKDLETWINLIKDIEEEVKYARVQGQILHGVFKSQTATRNNKMRDFDYETRDEIKDLMTKPEDVEPFNKFTHVNIKDIEVEDEKQLSPFTSSESTSRAWRQEKTETSYEYDPFKHKYKQKGGPTNSFYSNSKYEHKFMAEPDDNRYVDLIAKKLKGIIKSCRHEMEECERQLTQIAENIKKLPTVINVLQFQEKALEIERISLSQQKENAETLLQKQTSNLNHYRNTCNELQLKQNNKENEG